MLLPMAKGREKQKGITAPSHCPAVTDTVTPSPAVSDGRVGYAELPRGLSERPGRTRGPVLGENPPNPF